MQFDLLKAIDILINVGTIVVTALVIYNRLANRMSLMEQKFDILTGNGFITKEVVLAMEKRLDTRIDDLKATVVAPTK